MATVTIVETLESDNGTIRLEQEYLRCDTVEDANGIADKLNQLNAFYAKKLGSIIRFFYSVKP